MQLRVSASAELSTVVMPKVKPDPQKFLLWARFWPPFLGANICVAKVTPDYCELETRMKLSWFNRNWVGTHYGGSIFSMTDPFYMFMLINVLGGDYLVWDKSSCIEFKKPGTTELSAKFHLSEERIKEIIDKTKDGSPYFAEFRVEVLDTNEEVVATADKTVYVRKKKGR